MPTPDLLTDNLLSDPEEPLLRLAQELKQARAEIKNLLDLTAPIVPQPGQIPRIRGVDICGESIPLHGALGGDHIIFIDFERRYDMEERIRRAEAAGKDAVAAKLRSTRKKAGILVADVSGHSLTDATLAARLHDAFLSCVLYELDLYGTITQRVFETLNIRFYNSTTVNKFITMIYGEISENGAFEFISAAHPTPIVFSNEYDRIVDIDPDQFAIFPPLGTQPPEYHADRGRLRNTPLGFKKRYQTNEISLMGSGDIMIVHTDGLSDLHNSDGTCFSDALEGVLRSSKHLSAAEICKAIKEGISSFGTPNDDITYIVIKKQ